MIKDVLEIALPLKNGKEVKLKISGTSEGYLFLMEGFEAIEGEAPYQLVEGKFYDFEIEKGYYLTDAYGITSRNKINKNVGRISPNIYVGTLSLNVFAEEEPESCGIVKFEVQSIKTSYRQDYRKMLSDITEQCIELVFQHSSPVTQVVEADYEKDPRTLYQRFAFLQSVVDSEEFNDAVHKVISSPVTKWEESEIDKDIRGAGRFNNKSLRQIAIATNRTGVPENHPLHQRFSSIPARITINYKIETVDTPENRFVKHAIKTFLSLITELRSKTKDESKINLEARKIEDYLEQLLNHSVFKNIQNPTSLILNSPILQRKEGYREILKVWLMFHLAAQLTWKGGDDVYDIGKRDVAILYEYWLFFQLLKIIEKVFGIKPTRDLIVNTKDELGLQLKQGTHYPIKGICDKYSRKLRIQFSYNRTFSGNNDYPDGGSWTRNMRPDYTLSIWPDRIDEAEAERQEIIVHIHFDAKYKIEHIIESLGNVENLDEEKSEQNKGTYKRADLLKMHSYKDAIRRTGGAYILYPGKEKETYRKMGFREIIPGLGAFQIRPSENEDNGSKELEKFFTDVVSHFLNRASQRENAAFKQYAVHKNKPIDEDKVEEPIPEEYGPNRIIPDETYVLIAYCKSEAHLQWVRDNKLYNSRIGKQPDDITLNQKEAGARFILLHLEGITKSAEIYKLKQNSIETLTKQDLLDRNYPSPRADYYLGYELENDVREGFGNLTWDISKLVANIKTRKIRKPYAVSISELMKAKTSVI